MPKVSGKFFLLYVFLVTLSGCSTWWSTPCEPDAAAVLPDTQTPLPAFLRDVYPEPGSRVAQAVYVTWPEDEESRLFRSEPGTICVNLDWENLPEQNDYNLDRVVRSNLKVSTFSPNPCSISVYKDCVWGAVSLGILSFCWKVDLVPGIYEATYEYKQASGRVLSYTWSFEITE